MGISNHLIVTFDIKGARPGDRRYKNVDALLEENGTVQRVFKQVRLVTTRSAPQRIARQISDIIGPEGSVMICHASRPYRFVLGNENPNAAHRKGVETWFRTAG